MNALTKLDLVKLFRLVKYPTEKLEAPLPHSKRVCRLYKKCLQLSMYGLWGSHLNLPYVFMHKPLLDDIAVPVMQL